MIDAIELAADERVLLVSIPSPEEVAALAHRLTGGLVVGLGSPDEVSVARRKAREYHNVMFVPATPGEIPWQDGFFDRAIEPAGVWPQPAEAREIARVLATGGLFHLGRGPAGAGDLPGFVPVSGSGGGVILRRER